MRTLAMALVAAMTFAAPLHNPASAQIIYFNGSLGITRFDIQQEGSSWTQATTLRTGQRYRFVTTALNNSGDPANFDITNLKVLDLLKPCPGTLLFLICFGDASRGQEIAFTGLHLTIVPPAGGVGAYEFYRDADYTPPGMPVYSNTPDFDRVIERGRSQTIYAYFIWRGPSAVIISPVLPGQYVPQVTMKAKELRLRWLPDGPRANLQPNT